MLNKLRDCSAMAWIMKHRQPIAWTLVVLWAGFIFFMSSRTPDQLPKTQYDWSSFAHFCEYWVLAVLLIGALDVPWRKSWRMAVVAMVIASLYGITDEFHQLFVDGRCSDPVDWVVDTAGALTGALAGTWALSLARRWAKKTEHDSRSGF